VLAVCTCPTVCNHMKNVLQGDTVPAMYRFNSHVYGVFVMSIVNGRRIRTTGGCAALHANRNSSVTEQNRSREYSPNNH
jgi:hypothetical protein